MPLKDSDLNSLVISPSLSGVIYQARTLINELDRINNEEFPRESRLVRDVFLSIAEHILEELRSLHNPDRPFELGNEESSRIRILAKHLRDIHSYIRYLSASSPRQSPPAVQDALVELTERHFPKEYGEPVCIVRPQWTYNLKCVPLSQELKKISKENLDPDNKLKLKYGENIIPALWEKRLERLKKEGKSISEEVVPKQIGILSFAAIDTPDALFLPLLGHELGHFISFSPPTPYHEDPELLESAEINEDRVKEIIQNVTNKPPSPKEATRYYYILCNQIWICLRELLADRIAARMLGFSFFLAQAKFIKTLLSWHQPLILESGYPNIKLRLSEIFNQVTADGYPGNPLVFLQENSASHGDITSPLISYFEMWRRHLDELPVTVRKKSELFTEELLVEPFYKLVEDALNHRTLEILTRIAQKVIPDDKCARLTPNFFERIARLEQDLPPLVAGENIDSFAEIMSSAWAYQVIHGETRENEKVKFKKRFEEHNKTCRLMLKAIELIPVYQSIQSAKVDEVNHEGTPPQEEDLLMKKGVLSAAQIRHRTLLPITHPSRISISPLRTEKINGASLDVHLGNWFAYARRTKLKGIKIGDTEQEGLLRSTGQAEAFIPFDKTFLLHPGDLALGVTQEFIALPKDVMAFVEGRSSLGRLGLFVATATQVAPSFHGVIVLELANAGTVPLELWPGLGIAQLVFQTMSEPVPDDKLYKDKGKYYCQIKPLT